MKVFLLFLSVFILTGCGNSPGKPADESGYTIATLKGPSAMGMIRMIDSVNRADNSNINIKILNEPIQVRKMLFEGEADFAVLPTTMAALIYNKGLDYRLLAIPVWGTLYLFGSDSTISTWEDLRNKRVHVMAKGMTPDVLFRYLLQENGINPEKDITLDYSFPTHIDLANAVAAGRSELGVISEPLVSLVMTKNKEVQALLDLNEEWNKMHSGAFTQTAFIAKENIIRDHQKEVEKIVSAYEYSSRWVNENPDSAAILISEYGILPDSEIAFKSIPRSNLYFVRASTVRSQIKDYLEVFFTMNPDIIGGKMPDEEFIY